MTGTEPSLWDTEVLLRMDRAYRAIVLAKDDSPTTLEVAADDPTAMSALFAGLRARVGSQS
jgi:hypothetical protein